MKFQIGDKVVVTQVNSPDSLNDAEVKDYVGEEGVIKAINPTYYYPYEIVFNNEEIERMGNGLWAENEIDFASNHVKVEPQPNQFLYYNDTKRTVRIHPATKSHGTDCNMNEILAGEMRMFYLPEGSYPWVKMWDYGGESGLSLLVSPTPMSVEEMKAKKNAERIDEIIEMLKSEDGKIIDVFEALHNLKKWVN